MKHIIWKLNGLCRSRLRQSTLKVPVYSGTLPAPSQMSSQVAVLRKEDQESMALDWISSRVYKHQPELENSTFLQIHLF